MYIADYHTHSHCSPDGMASMTDMAAAAVKKGLSEICFTDHVDLLPWAGGDVLPHFDFSAIAADFKEAQERWGDKIQLRLGMEMGDMVADFDVAQQYLQEAPPMDFIIGSIHRASPRFQREDLIYMDRLYPRWDDMLTDYLEELYRHAQWGRFSVLGHLTLPLRYARENFGYDVTFEHHMTQVEQVLKMVIKRGIGIECNTNRGNLPLPDGEILRMYRQLGGEIITLGSDAHRPQHVGMAIAERQQLLKDCGFRYFCTFEQMKPIFHTL